MTSWSFSEKRSEQLYQELLERSASKDIDKESIVKPVVAVLTDRYRLYIGRAEWKEVRIHPTQPFRDCGVDIYLLFSHPKIESVISDVIACSKAGAVSAAIAAIIGVIAGANGGAGAVSLSAFEAAFYACMYTKGTTWASEISIDLETENKRCGNWYGL